MIGCTCIVLAATSSSYQQPHGTLLILTTISSVPTELNGAAMGFALKNKQKHEAVIKCRPACAPGAEHN